MRKLTKMAVMIAVLALAYSAAASATTLTIWQGNVGAKAEARAVYTDILIPTFEKMHPGVKVEVNYFSWSTFNDQLGVAYATGNGPDIVNENNLPDFVENGFIVPIDKYLAQWDEWQDFIPGLDDMIVWKGHTYGVPQILAPRLLVYNKQHFADAGLNPNRPPEDWDALREYALKLTKRDGDNIEQIGVLRQSVAAGGFDLFLWANGGEMMDPDSRQPLFSSPKGVEALRFISELAQEVNPVGTAASGSLFYTGKASMATGATSKTALAFRDNFGDDPGMAALPPAEKGGKGVVVLYGGPLALGSQSKNPDLAWEFMKLMMSFENQSAMNQALGFIPPRRRALGEGYVSKDTILWEYLKQASQYGRAAWIFRAPEKPQLLSTLQEQIDQTFEGQQSPGVALEKAADGWQTLMDEYWDKKK